MLSTAAPGTQAQAGLKVRLRGADLSRVSVYDSDVIPPITGISARLLVFESSPDSGVSEPILSTGAPRVPVQEVSPRPKMSDYSPQSALRIGSKSDEEYDKSFRREVYYRPAD